MDTALEELCDVFQDEVERQHAVLGLLQSQLDAARLHDAPALELKTKALNSLIMEAKTAETRRLGAVQELVARYAMPVERQTMTELIAAIPEPYKSRLAHLQRHLRAILLETKSLVRESGIVIRASLRVADKYVRVVSEAFNAENSGYGAGGRDIGAHLRTAVLLDHRG